MDAPQVQVRTIEEAERHIESLTANVIELRRLVRDHDQRFDTLQTPLWKRIMFRIDGWPGQRNLNSGRQAGRPWHRWWRS